MASLNLPIKPTTFPPKTITSSSSSNGSLTTRGSPGLRVAYQGSTGAYSELAAKTAIPGCHPLPSPSFSSAVSAIHRSLADIAILPVESTISGTSLRNYDLLLRDSDLRIVQEINLFVQYCLLAVPGVQPSDLRRVISHPTALAHCGRALSRLGLRREPVDDTAGAVKLLQSARLLDTAAIASPRTATIYGLDVIAHGIQDENWNVTRFLLLSENPEPMQPPNSSSSFMKTSIVIAHHGDSMPLLLKVLSAFSSRKINLTKLEVNNPTTDGESPVVIMDRRGSLRSFPHVLYVDFEGSVEDENVKDAVDEISKIAVFVRILGCYAADPNVYHLH